MFFRSRTCNQHINSIVEIARDFFLESGTHQVIGGIISPTNDTYNKPGLIASTHRCAMIKGVIQSSDWIRLSDWECKQENWTRTRISLQYHQVIFAPASRNSLNFYLIISFSSELCQLVHQ